MKSSAATFALLVVAIVLATLGVVIFGSIDRHPPSGTLREIEGMLTIDLVGEINASMQRRATRTLGDLERQGARRVVVVVDSTGGEVAATLELAESFSKSPSETLALVRNCGGGTVLLVAAMDRIYCTPTAVFGAAVPVMISSRSDAPDPVVAKVSSVLTAKIRAFVATNGHDPELLAAFVDPAVTLTRNGKVVKPKGAVLTLTAKEALELKLSEGTFPTVEALIAHLKAPVAETTP